MPLPPPPAALTLLDAQLLFYDDVDCCVAQPNLFLVLLCVRPRAPAPGGL